MGQPPLPPHERSWRHPSELAAAEREAFRTADVSPTSRILAMVTGTMGLIAVGILVMSTAPRRHDSPVAVGSTTAPVVEVVGRSGIAAIGRFASDDTDEPTAPQRVAPALATPVGDGRSAVMTRRSTSAGEGEAFDVRLVSGPVVTAAVLDATDDDVVVVTIVAADPGHVIAAAQPEPDEIVTVLANPPVTVAYADVDTVGAEEGTPIVDGNGELVGLCTRGTSGVVEIATTPQAPPSTVPAPPVSGDAAATTAAP